MDTVVTLLIILIVVGFGVLSVVNEDRDKKVTCELKRQAEDNYGYAETDMTKAVEMVACDVDYISTGHERSVRALTQQRTEVKNDIVRYNFEISVKDKDIGKKEVDDFKERLNRALYTIKLGNKTKSKYPFIVRSVTVRGSYLHVAAEVKINKVK